MVVLATGAAGCAESEGSTTDAPITKAHVMALSTYSATLGTPIDAYIQNPPTGNARAFELVFDGTFTRPNGATEPVNLVQAVNRTEAGAVRWTAFGPFGNPFTPNTPDIGKFTGKLGIRVTMDDGTVINDEKPIPLSFEVKPSIIITELRPVDSTCGEPALRMLGGMSYRLKATTIGFDAKTIDYMMQTPGIVPDDLGEPQLDVDSGGKPRMMTRQLSHTMMNNTDTVEGKDAFVLPPVPIDIPNYGVVMAIVAHDDQGHSVSTTFGMTAHNPIEIFYDGRYELAQIYPAKPVSGCMPGGQQGRAVTYSESQMESRQRQLSVTMSKTFLRSEENNWSTSDGKTVTHGTTNTDGYSRSHTDSNSFTFTKTHEDTSGVQFMYSSGNTVVGKAGVSFKVFGIGADAGGEYQHRWDKSQTSSSSSSNGWSSANTSGSSDTSEVNHSTATTDSTAVSQTNTKGGSESQQAGEGEAVQNMWTVTSQQTIDRGFAGMVVANTQGVFYRQMARYTQKAFVVVYDKCGAGDVVGDVTLQDYVWAPDLALGDKCPPLPVSNFPEPQCRLPPCDP